MKIAQTKIPGVKIIIPTVYHDERGYFVEQYISVASLSTSFSGINNTHNVVRINIRTMLLELM